MRPSPIRERGRSIVTTCTAASSSITWRSDTVRRRCPTGWLVAREAFDRSCLVERASASCLVATACRRNGRRGSSPNETTRCGCETSFEPVPRVSRRRRVCATSPISRRFRARLPTDRGSRFSGQTRDASRSVSMSPISRRATRRRIARVNSPHAFSWTRDGRSIVFSQLELVDTARALGDLYRIDVDSGRGDAPHARCAARLAGRSPERPDDRGRAVPSASEAVW